MSFNPLKVDFSKYLQDSNSPENIEISITFEQKELIELQKTREYSIPLHVLNGKSSLQSIVYYLKENHNLSFATISQLLNRDQRTIWTTYTKAKSRNYTLTEEYGREESYSIPVSILKIRELSVLESVVHYLRNFYLLSFKQISILLGKNYRTVYTVYKRGLKKIV